MPHIIIDYSANLGGQADIGGLCEALRRAAVSLDTFPQAGVRVRAFAAEHYAIADGDAQNGFIDISVRLRAGRSQALKEAATAALFAVAKAHLGELIAARPMLLSLEMRDIDARLSPKLNTIRDRLEGQAGDD